VRMEADGLVISAGLDPSGEAVTQTILWDSVTITPTITPIHNYFNHWNILTACVTAVTSGLLLFLGCGPLLLHSSPASDPLLGTKRLLFSWAWLSTTSAGLLFSVLPWLPRSAFYGAAFYHFPLWTVYYLFARWVVSLYFMNRRYAQGLTEVEEWLHLLTPGIFFLVLVVMIVLDFFMMRIMMENGSTEGFVAVQIMLSTVVFILVAAALSRSFRADEMGFTPSALPVLRRLRATLPLLGLAAALMLALKAACYLGKDFCHALRVPFSAANHETEHEQGSTMNAASFFYATGVVMLPSALIAWSFTAPVPFLGLFSPRGSKDGLECGVADPGCLFSLGVALFACSSVLLRTSRLSEETEHADSPLTLPSPTSLLGTGEAAAGRAPPSSSLQLLGQIARMRQRQAVQVDAKPMQSLSEVSQSTPVNRVPWNVFRKDSLGVVGGDERVGGRDLVASDADASVFGSMDGRVLPSCVMGTSNSQRDGYLKFGSLSVVPPPQRFGLSVRSEIIPVASESAAGGSALGLDRTWTGAADTFSRSGMRPAASSPIGPLSQGDTRSSTVPRESAVGQPVQTTRQPSAHSVVAESSIAAAGRVVSLDERSLPFEKELEREQPDLVTQDAEHAAGWSSRQFQVPVAVPWSLEDLSLRQSGDNEQQSEAKSEDRSLSSS